MKLPLFGSLKSPLFKFLFFFVLIYSLLYFLHEWLIKTYTLWDQKFISHIISVSDYLIRALGYKTFKNIEDKEVQVLGIDGSTGVWVGSPCNAISLFILFAAFIIPFPGSHKQKWWYIPTGMVFIHFTNILRVVALCMIAYHSPFTLDFNHTYTFTFLVYLFIFMLWVLWVKKFSGIDVNSRYA